MSHEVELSKANGLQLAKAFRAKKGVYYSIDCDGGI
jgi:hypothetical protein